MYPIVNFQYERIKIKNKKHFIYIFLIACGVFVLLCSARAPGQSLEVGWLD
jgi:hypothetical protein